MLPDNPRANALAVQHKSLAIHLRKSLASIYATRTIYAERTIYAARAVTLRPKGAAT